MVKVKGGTLRDHGQVHDIIHVISVTLELITTFRCYASRSPAVQFYLNSVPAKELYQDKPPCYITKGMI